MPKVRRISMFFKIIYLLYIIIYNMKWMFSGSRPTTTNLLNRKVQIKFFVVSMSYILYLFPLPSLCFSFLPKKKNIERRFYLYQKLSENLKRKTFLKNQTNFEKCIWLRRKRIYFALHRCTNSLLKYGNALQCAMCQQRCAFDRPDHKVCVAKRDKIALTKLKKLLVL